MRKAFATLLVALAATFAPIAAHAVENTWDASVRAHSVVQTSPARITLTWPQDQNGTPSSYTVFRKAPGASSWGSGTTLPGSATSYVDTNVNVGTAYEYRIVKAANGYTGYGYIQTGIQVPLVEKRGKVVLLVDNTHASALASELTRLQQDLVGDGWTVLRHDVSPTASVPSIKNIIKAEYNADPANVKSVFLFGRIPVPYSGDLVPDGHPDHRGAWPADVYYGDMDGNWTDNSVNFSQTQNTNPAERTRLSNKPGDGKFDQTTIPSAVELQVGRVDFHNMPGVLYYGGPTTFPSERALLRQYLDKDHNFRHRVLNPRRRAVVGDYFGWRNGETFSSSAYGAFAAFFGADKTLNLNVAHNDRRGVWVPELAANDYLTAYGAGAGSYTTISGLGNAANYNSASTPEIVENNIKSVFNWVFGSWLGDWDSQDNFMRGILATKDYGLTAAWSGRPHWFMHPMGLGETVGYVTRLTQNNSGLYQNQVSSSQNRVHVALMGDPTLRLHPVAPARSFSGSRNGSTATLSWQSSTDSVVGYHVYRASSLSGPYTRLTNSVVSGTSYTDNNSSSGAHYMVRAVKLESTPSGSYYNASQGLFWSAGGTSTPTPDTSAPTVSLTAPSGGATVSGTVTVSANAYDNVGVVGVQFQRNGVNIGSEDTSAPYSVSWNTTQSANGSASLTAIARDAAGNRRTSAVVTVNVNNTSTPPPSSPGDPTSPAPAPAGVWFDDALPAGAVGQGSEPWTWVTSNPAPFSGTRAHQSINAAGLHEHAFAWASETMTVATGNVLFAYVYLDPANPPSTIMLSWNSGGSWDHRAYWGANNINYGVNGTASRLRIGGLPATGRWVRLEVPAAAVGLEGKTVTGMSFSTFNGRTTWDQTGTATTSQSGPISTPADTKAPKIALTNPADTDRVSGQITLKANATDNVGVATVRFKLNDQNLGPKILTAPYNYRWDTAGTPNGTHTLTAVATDAAGNKTTAEVITVRVRNVVDTTSPFVSLTAPANKAKVSGRVTLKADATDDVAIASVQFRVGSRNIGKPVTTAPFTRKWDSTTVADGSRKLTAIATDTSGNTRVSSVVNVTVDNTVTAKATPTDTTTDTTKPKVSVTAPKTGATVSGKSVTLKADASDNVGVAYVRFRVNGIAVGTRLKTAPYTFTWDSTSVPDGTHVISAVAFDAAGNKRVSSEVSVKVANLDATKAALDTTKPKVAVTAPKAGATVSGKSVTFKADASDNVGVDYVRFRVNGNAVGTKLTTAPYTYAWDSTTVANGAHTVSAVAYDKAGNKRVSANVSITVNNPAAPTEPPAPVVTDTAWFDDALPAGASGSGGGVWNWATTTAPAPFSGTRAHQSIVGSGIHDYTFNWASQTLTVATGETLYAYIYLDPANPPTQVMLSWNGGSWDHRAYWGANTINHGVNGTASRLRIGDLPAAGRWVRLEIPASALGLEGKTVTGLSLSLNDGRVWLDQTGKASGSSSTTPDATTPAPTDPVSPTPVADTTAPTVSLSAPAAGATVFGTSVAVSANASDDVGVVGVQFKLNGANLGAEDTTAPYSVTWNTTLVANGTHVLTAVARDAAGNTRTAANVSVTVNNPVAPTEPTEPVNPTPAPETEPLAENLAIALPKVGDHTLTVLSPTVLELERITTKAPDPATVSDWNFVSSTGAFTAPAASKFTVTVDGVPVSVKSVGFKRRVRYGAHDYRDLRIGNQLYLELAAPVGENKTVVVRNPDATLWPATMVFAAKSHPLRHSPAIHVNQEGYVPSFVKQAKVGHYLGNLGELNVAAGTSFRLINALNGATAFTGTLVARPDVGYRYSPTPYQKVLMADFSAFKTPGEYQLVVPGLGASFPFLIDEGIAMGFTRTYALGLYHQRSGRDNVLPFTRHTRSAGHTAPAEIPATLAGYEFTWTTIASKNADTATTNPAGVGRQLKDPASQLYPFVNTGKVDVSGGHFDAGDYSKYTINSAQLAHTLLFTADSIAGAGDLDNLGLPESSDGISDILQMAKIETDYIAKLQDADGGFYFIVYPKTRAYESNVLPDNGDTQVVWPKNTAASAASVAALAQAASSPRFKAAYPTVAAAYLEKAKLGWQFLTNAIATHGKLGSYQKITFYGDNYIHNDEIAWAAASLYAATGEAKYHTALMEWFPNPADPATMRWSWWRMSEGWGNAIRTYAFAARSGRLAANKLDATYLAACENQIKLAGNDALTWSQNNAYGSAFPTATKHVMSAGWYFSLDQASDMAVAYQLDPRQDYLDALVGNMNYEAGSNPVNVAYLTGIGLKRQREVVSQYAKNDRRVLPPAGIPIGNITSNYSFLPTYGASGNELSKLSFPSDAGSSNVYAFYDRWADVWNVTGEFVSVNQARSLMAVATLANRTAAKSTPWKSAAARVVIPSTVVPLDEPVTLTLDTAGLNLAGARILWEGRDQEPDFGATYTFTPRNIGDQWVEAEIVWPDGRRVVAVNTFKANSPTFVWVDDAIPAGAWTLGNESWNWTGSNPAPHSGLRSHQSAISTGLTEHAFTDAASPLVIEAGDLLFVWVYLDPNNKPRQLMLHWNDGNWDHRAYWGENLISYGTNGTASRYRVGDLPAVGEWVKLEVPAKAVGLEGRSVKGMSFSVFGGRATWDTAGKFSPEPTNN